MRFPVFTLQGTVNLIDPELRAWWVGGWIGKKNNWNGWEMMKECMNGNNEGVQSTW